jgi:GDP-mannose 6-dehydrogenase
MLELAERLIGKGFEVKIYDATVVLSRLTGANKAYISQQLPHIGDLLTDDVEAVLDHGEVLIAGSREPEVVDAITRAGSDRLIVDLVRLPGAAQLRGAPNYQGIGW